MNVINITAFDHDNVTKDFDNVASTIFNLTLCNCTDNELIIDIIIPTLLFTKPCGISLLCLISFMVYTLIKPLFNKK